MGTRAEAGSVVHRQMQRVVQEGDAVIQARIQKRPGQIQVPLRSMAGVGFGGGGEIGYGGDQGLPCVFFGSKITWIIGLWDTRRGPDVGMDLGFLFLLFFSPLFSGALELYVLMGFVMYLYVRTVQQYNLASVPPQPFPLLPHLPSLGPFPLLMSL